MAPPITVKKDELLSILKNNRSKHRTVFENALDGWRKEAEKQLEQRHQALHAGKIPDLRIGLITPEDHTRDYDRVIRMVEMHQGDLYPLDEQSFAQFVMDDWSWRRQFLNTSNFYAGKTVQEVYGDVEG